jgi:hypothetical protein
MANELEVLFCPDCRREVFAEAPPCSDGHDDACPDRACVDCGTALLLDAPLFQLITSRLEPTGTAVGASIAHRTHAA